MESSSNRNIEDSSIRISLKMMWTIVASMVVASFSLAGFYFNIQGQINKGVSVDELQNLQLEVIKLNATKTEIDLREIARKLDLKEDKK
ncbi:MAG: hypothetical protein EOO89_30170 [Pedobacter sp.]|nr:MAG: hypothetical protein EOO89_30170 [Pedobacter sp.]